MEPLQTYEIPLLHPLAVHFPIALLLVGLAALLAWVVNPSVFWYRCSALAYLAGSLGATAAYFTGEAAEDAAELVPIVEEIVEIHELMAIATLASALITLLAIVLIRPKLLWGDIDDLAPPAIGVRVAVGALGLVTAVLVALTSHLGGLMVWGVPR